MQSHYLRVCIIPSLSTREVDSTQLTEPGFTPTELFASLYEPLCSEAWYLAAQDCDWVCRRDRIVFLHAVVSQMGLARSVLQHEAEKGLQRVRWKSLCCLCPWDAQPLVMLPCGHGICERDAWRYSGIDPQDTDYPTLSHYTACPVCRASMNLHVRHRPLQAGYRVAAFDGGGDLGMISLVALRSITEDLPPALFFHHYVDVVVGTSTGQLLNEVHRVGSTDKYNE